MKKGCYQSGSSLLVDRLINSIIIYFIEQQSGGIAVERLILSEQGYREQMENVVKPYLDIRKSVLWPEREEGRKSTVRGIWRTVRRVW